MYSGVVKEAEIYLLTASVWVRSSSSPLLSRKRKNIKKSFPEFGPKWPLMKEWVFAERQGEFFSWLALQAEVWLPKAVHALIPEPVNMYITWQKENKVVNGIKVANQFTLKQGGYPGLSQWALCNHMSSQKQRRKTEHEMERCNRRTQLNYARFEYGGRGLLWTELCPPP